MLVRLFSHQWQTCVLDMVVIEAAVKTGG